MKLTNPYRKLSPTNLSNCLIHTYSNINRHEGGLQTNFQDPILGLDFTLCWSRPNKEAKNGHVTDLFGRIQV